MSTKITFNKQNSANADYVINLIYNNHDTNVAINSFKRNSGLCQEHLFFFAWITTVSLKMTTFFRCQIMSLDAYISKLLFKDKLVQERYLDLFLSFLNLFEVKAYFFTLIILISSYLFIVLIYLFFSFFGKDCKNKLKFPYHYRGLIMTLVKKVECPELNGKRMRSGFWDRRPEALLLKKLSCTQSNKFWLFNGSCFKHIVKIW